MSDKDFKGLLLALKAIFPRLPLSIKVSTASCSNLFSLRMINCGASISNNLSKRLLRVIIRRYSSFKSEVANQPPSNRIIGLRAGGITGKIVKIIQAGLDPVPTKFSKIRIRFIACSRIL